MIPSSADIGGDSVGIDALPMGVDMETRDHLMMHGYVAEGVAWLTVQAGTEAVSDPG
jgi:hypothetical protein